MKFVIFRDKKKEYRFNLVGKNGEIVMTSEGYKSKAMAKKTIISSIFAIQNGLVIYELKNGVEIALEAICEGSPG